MSALPWFDRIGGLQGRSRRVHRRVRQGARLAVAFLASMALFAACAEDSAGGGAGGAGGGGGGGSSSGGVTVRVFHTSGLPPVEYDVADAQALDSLRDRLVGLTAAERSPTYFDFGRPTFEILNPEGIAGLPPRIRFWDGTLELRASDATATYHYDEKGVYTWLMDEGAKALPPIPAEHAPP